MLDFTFAKRFFAENQIDLVICDHIAESCVEAAIASNLPFIVTATADYTKGMYRSEHHSINVLLTDAL